MSRLRSVIVVSTCLTLALSLATYYLTLGGWREAYRPGRLLPQGVEARLIPLDEEAMFFIESRAPNHSTRSSRLLYVASFNRLLDEVAAARLRSLLGNGSVLLVVDGLGRVDPNVTARLLGVDTPISSLGLAVSTSVDAVIVWGGRAGSPPAVLLMSGFRDGYAYLFLDRALRTLRRLPGWLKGCRVLLRLGVYEAFDRGAVMLNAYLVDRTVEAEGRPTPAGGAQGYRYSYDVVSLITYYATTGEGLLGVLGYRVEVLNGFLSDYEPTTTYPVSEGQVVGSYRVPFNLTGMIIDKGSYEEERAEWLFKQSQPRRVVEAYTLVSVRFNEELALRVSVEALDIKVTLLLNYTLPLTHH